MNKRRALGLAGLVAAAVVAVAVVAIVLRRAEDDAPTHAGEPPGSDIAPSHSGLDPLVEEFRATERSTLHRYNTALREQRENMIDELELSNVIERDVLTPWRALRAKVSAAPAHDELYATLRRYLEARQIAWEAYVAALRAPTDAAARPHYDAHRQNNAAAQEHAKQLGRMFREAAARAHAPR